MSFLLIRPKQGRSPNYSASVEKVPSETRSLDSVFEMVARAIRPLVCCYGVDVDVWQSGETARRRRFCFSPSFVLNTTHTHTSKHSAADPGQSEHFLLSLFQLISSHIFFNDICVAEFLVYFPGPLFSSNVGCPVTHRSPVLNGTWGNTCKTQVRRERVKKRPESPLVQCVYRERDAWEWFKRPA